MNYFQSGSSVVDQVGQICFNGNITPHIWYQTILTDKQKPHYLAIAILSDIVYWYRPVEVRDEQTGQVIGWRKRFKYDLLQRSYEQLAETMGENVRTIRRAVQFLDSIGVIKRHRRTLKFSNGVIARNVLFLELVPRKLYELTYPQIETLVPHKSDGYAGNTNEFELVGMEEEGEETDEKVAKESTGKTDNKQQERPDSGSDYSMSAGVKRNGREKAYADRSGKQQNVNTDQSTNPNQFRRRKEVADRQYFEDSQTKSGQTGDTEWPGGWQNSELVQTKSGQTGDTEWSGGWQNFESVQTESGQTRDTEWPEGWQNSVIPQTESGQTGNMKLSEGWPDYAAPLTKSGQVGDKIWPGTRQNLARVPDKSGQDTGQIWPGQRTEMVSTMTTDGQTNTEITTQTSTENTSYHSINHPTENYFAQSSGSQIDLNDPNTQALAYMQIIRDNLNYDEAMEYKSDEDKQEIEEAYNLICDVVCVKRQTINIGGVEYPWELVKSRFLKLTWEHVDYVSLCMHDRGGREGISNIHAYMLAALYNAPSTMNRYYEQRVRHDFYRGDDRVNA